MHAPLGSNSQRPTKDAAPTEAPRRERLISIPYLLLRGSTAAGAFAMGFVQTFVFARILDPERFSIFIITAAVGYSLWITDLGLAKIAFVNLRTPHLAGRKDDQAARQAGAVILFYILLSVAAALVCFAVELVRNGAGEAFDLALFLLFIALNLAWFSLRTVSIAVDLFVFFERLELVRRAVNIATLLAMLIGLPLSVFLVGSNVLWALLFIAAMTKLVRRGALVLHVRGFVRELTAFFRSNWHSVSRSSTGALSGLFVATFPYYIVPIAFGLGAAPIILDTVFKIFRGACVIFAAVCDLAIPGQTRAYNTRDAKRLVLTTLLAVGLCAIPALAACGLLIFGGKELYAFLLRTAATVPPQVTPIVVVLLLASILQIVAEALLQYTGYFRSLALNGVTVVVMMIIATIVAFAAKLGLVGFLAAYAVAYSLGAILMTTMAVLGPISAAAAPPDGKPSLGGLLKALRSARQAQAA
jgi:O-antigen/teichoic acid export membrane protein